MDFRVASVRSVTIVGKMTHILVLASDDATYVTGTLLDGGYTAM